MKSNFLKLAVAELVIILLLVGGYFFIKNQNNPQITILTGKESQEDHDHGHGHEHDEKYFEEDSGQNKNVDDENQNTTDSTESISSKYLSSYSIIDTVYGTETKVTVNDLSRIIQSNALPNHDTGIFPNSGNPNPISAQSKTYTLPVEGNYTGNAVWAREPGVAINGVKFEPETAERVECLSGEQYRIEAFQDFANLGFDTNNAHVQPTGEYHYHGVSDNLVKEFSDDKNMVHVGFAKDGHLIYYDKTDSYKPSYVLKSEERVGSSCLYRNKNVVVNGTSPDGTYVSDWEYEEDLGALDECNGSFVDGEYAYFITDTYPYVGRCLKGEFSEERPSEANGQQQVGVQQRSPTGNQSSPPQEAIVACSSKSSGNSCSIQTPNGLLSGICNIPPNSNTLACIPNNR